MNAYFVVCSKQDAVLLSDRNCSLIKPKLQSGALFGLPWSFSFRIMFVILAAGTGRFLQGAFSSLLESQRTAPKARILRNPRKWQCPWDPTEPRLRSRQLLTPSLALSSGPLSSTSSLPLLHRGSHNSQGTKSSSCHFIGHQGPRKESQAWALLNKQVV